MALADYAPRYAAVARVGAGAVRGRAPATTSPSSSEVPGDATTTFGAPERPVHRPTGATSRPPRPTARCGCSRPSWAELDRLAVEAPEQLRKGPRGGGRDRDKVVAHVIEAERSYARKIGVRHPPFHGDPAALEACRAEVEQVLRAARSGEPMPGWPARYFLRRAAWHVLDHVWEIEDKS